MNGNRLTPRAFLAREIQRARETKGISRDALASALFVSESLLRAWEKGRRLPQPDHLAKLEEICGTGHILSRMREELVNTAVPLEWLGRWLEIEAVASSLLAYEPLVLPGLLQIEEYARALLRFSRQSEFELEDQVSARLERQRVWTRDDPLSFVAVLDEAVLYRPIGGRQVMAAQLTHVVDMARRSDNTVQVIPFDAGEYAGLAGAFTMATMDGKEYAYLDNAVSGDVIEHPEDVAEIKRRWELLRGDSLSRKASLALIEEAVKRWN